MKMLLVTVTLATVIASRTMARVGAGGNDGDGDA
jgi:hypothetical protein